MPDCPTVTLAKPGEQGTATSFSLSGSGELLAVNAIEVIKPVIFDFGSSWSELAIRSASGRTVRNSTDATSLDVSGLAEGHYTLSGMIGGLLRSCSTLSGAQRKRQFSSVNGPVGHRPSIRVKNDE